jgi:hypothetical protein
VVRSCWVLIRRWSLGRLPRVPPSRERALWYWKNDLVLLPPIGPPQGANLNLIYGVQSPYRLTLALGTEASHGNPMGIQMAYSRLVPGPRSHFERVQACKEQSHFNFERSTATFLFSPQRRWSLAPLATPCEGRTRADTWPVSEGGLEPITRTEFLVEWERSLSLPWTWRRATPLGKRVVTNEYKWGSGIADVFYFTKSKCSTLYKCRLYGGKARNSGDWTSTCLRSPRGVKRLRWMGSRYGS